jgi:putative flippase GtrA
VAAPHSDARHDGEGGYSSVSGNDQGLVRRLRTTYEVLAREAAKFGIVGGIAFVTDFGIFNLLRYAGPDGVGVLHHKPLTANVISTVISILVAWLGNRYWTFRHRRRASAPRELLLFFVMNGVGLLISLVCLGFTYYVLDLRGPVASNVSAKIVGVALGTLFRWWAYRRFVFVQELEEEGWSAPAQVDDVSRREARPGAV